jgi:ABC-type sugar transport system ATPase subunit
MEKNYLPVKTYVIEDMGSYNIVDVKLGKETVKVRTLPTLRPEIGSECYIDMDMNRVSLFDLETGNSLTE